jgi:eukaryotic-like serine/threonine-protein kinase
MSIISGSKVWIDDATQQAITLGPLLKSGGAGSVFQIREAATKVVKIYHQDQPLAMYEKKVKAMLTLSPNLADITHANERYVQIAWPENTVRDKRGQFLGFVMPSLDIKATSELEYILQERQARAEGLPTGLGPKITLAANLSAVIAELHKQGHYVVDMKPVNLRFYRHSLYMAMLDCDGFSIRGENERFEAPQFTPDYLAPEFHLSGISADGEEQQDRFALAVVIFQLLNFGIHPFSGRPSSDRVPTDIPGRIQARAYAYGLRANKSISPSVVSGHEVVAADLRHLFDRAFESKGNTRPSAAEWAESLKKYAQKSTGNLLVCQKNTEHQHFLSLACGACARDALLKKAKQPSAAMKAKATANATPTNIKHKARNTKTAKKRRVKPTASANARRVQQILNQPAPVQNSVPLSGWHVLAYIARFIFRFSIKYPGYAAGIFLFFVFIIPSFFRDEPNQERVLELEPVSITEEKIDSEFEPDLTPAIVTEIEGDNTIQPAENNIYEADELKRVSLSLEATRILILPAATSIAAGDTELALSSMALLQRNAEKLESPTDAGINAYQEAQSIYSVASNNETFQGEYHRKLLVVKLNRILLSEPTLTIASMELARIYAMDSQMEKAEKNFIHTIWVNPNYAPAWQGLGISKLATENDETLVGIFTMSELLYREMPAYELMGEKVQKLSRQFSNEDRKRLFRLQIRAQQLAADLRAKGISFEPFEDTVIDSADALETSRSDRRAIRRSNR